MSVVGMQALGAACEAEGICVAQLVQSFPICCRIVEHIWCQCYRAREAVGHARESFPTASKRPKVTRVLDQMGGMTIPMKNHWLPPFNEIIKGLIASLRIGKTPLPHQLETLQTFMSTGTFVHSADFLLQRLCSKRSRMAPGFTWPGYC